MSKIGDYSSKPVELSKVCVERTQHHKGQNTILRKVRSCFNLNQCKGQYPLLSNFCPSILLDALDLCKDQMHEWPDGDNNFMQEYIQRKDLMNGINEEANQLVIVDGKNVRELDRGKALSVVPLATANPNNLQLRKCLLGNGDDQDWSTPSKGEDYLEVSFLNGVNEQDEEQMSEWVFKR